MHIHYLPSHVPLIDVQLTSCSYFVPEIFPSFLYVNPFLYKDTNYYFDFFAFVHVHMLVAVSERDVFYFSELQSS